MSVAKIAEKYVKDWFKKVKNKVAIIEHGEGYDLRVNEEDLFIEVKGSTKSNFMDFRPYLTLNELNNAVNKGEKFEIHVLLGIKNGKPSKHWVIKGSEFAKYGEFVKAAYEFKECWSKKLAKDGILAVDVLVYLKKLIGQPV
ncbi:MAG: DUF3883 domain-containing protein [Candidatus Bathyarchaeia archaeon]